MWLIGNHLTWDALKTATIEPLSYEQYRCNFIPNPLAVKTGTIIVCARTSGDEYDGPQYNRDSSYSFLWSLLLLLLLVSPSYLASLVSHPIATQLINPIQFQALVRTALSDLQFYPLKGCIDLFLS